MKTVLRSQSQPRLSKVHTLRSRSRHKIIRSISLTEGTALLLDVDGVIVKNKELIDRVADNCVQFVHHILPHTTLEEAFDINKAWYKSRGHTLRGMLSARDSTSDCLRNQLYCSDIEAREMFNEIVYGHDTLHALDAYLMSDGFVKDSKRIAVICNACFTKKIPVFLLSNAPNAWCIPILNRFESVFFENRSLITDVLTPDHPIFTTDMYKPDSKLYDRVEKYVASTMFNADKTSLQFIFVDDSIVNLLPLANSKSWTPILYPTPDNVNIHSHTHTIEKLEAALGIDTLKTDVSTDSTSRRKVLLHGGPFVNINTVKMLLRVCVPSLCETEASRIAHSSTLSNQTVVVIECSEESAYTYCQRLVDNGLLASIE